jgi:hypothetical protein
MCFEQCARLARTTGRGHALCGHAFGKSVSAAQTTTVRVQKSS